MRPIPVCAGDVFVVENRFWPFTWIKGVEKFWSTDNHSVYGHAGIIQSTDGTTLEALSHVSEQNLFTAYSGSQVLIARPREATLLAMAKSITALRKQHLGQHYPVWRLAFHLFPPAAKYFSAKGNYVVCSELVAKYLYMIGHRHEFFTGANPDMLADEWVRWRNFDVLYEGKLE